VATGLATGLAWAALELALKLDFEGSGLAVGSVEVAGGGLAKGWAVACVVVVAGVIGTDLAATAREDAGAEAMAIEEFWVGGKKQF